MRAGVAELEGLGFRVRVPEGLFVRTGFTAGGAERRLVELHGLFSDDEVAGIFCGRGGAGCGGLLPRLDAGLIAAHPKVFVGYSDTSICSSPAWVWSASMDPWWRGSWGSGATTGRASFTP